MSHTVRTNSVVSQSSVSERRISLAVLKWFIPVSFFSICLGLIGCTNRLEIDPPGEIPPGMAWIPGGEFNYGTEADDVSEVEKPVHRVKLSGFYMDVHEVTNAQFRDFVQATNYVTTAEIAPDWEELKKQVPPGTPKPPEEKLVPGSLVFRPTMGPVPLNEFYRWWEWTPGANWKHPEGPKSTIEGKDDHPVVHVSWDDAVAYAKWSGKELPTEAQWEYAARGGLANKRYPWGDEPPSDTTHLANIWHGDFPYRNTMNDGYERTAPVKKYAPNGYGLYDMAGNVWEWCADWYRVDQHFEMSQRGKLIDPTGPETFFDPNEPEMPKRVIRGGSYLCHVSYCESYRTTARRGNPFDSGMCHVGFRCVINPNK